MGRIVVRVRRELCMGHGRCSALAPEIFSVDAAGYCAIVEVALERRQLGRAKLAEANCPEGAITVEGGEGSS
jgi:ferredoxin